MVYNYNYLVNNYCYTEQRKALHLENPILKLIQHFRKQKGLSGLTEIYYYLFLFINHLEKKDYLKLKGFLITFTSTDIQAIKHLSLIITPFHPRFEPMNAKIQ